MYVQLNTLFLDIFCASVPGFWITIVGLDILIKLKNVTGKDVGFASVLTPRRPLPPFTRTHSRQSSYIFHLQFVFHAWLCRYDAWNSVSRCLSHLNYSWWQSPTAAPIGTMYLKLSRARIVLGRERLSFASVCTQLRLPTFVVLTVEFSLVRKGFGVWQWFIYGSVQWHNFRVFSHCRHEY